MRKFLTNWELKVLAVMAAVIFWFLVIGAENTFYTFPEEVSIKAFNLSEEFVVSNELGGVKIRLKVENRDNIKSLASDDFNAYVDLEGFAEGDRELPVIVNSKKSDIRVLKVEPAKIEVKIEENVEKEVEIEYEIIGEPEEGYKVEEVILSEQNAVLKGAQRVLNTIDFVIVRVELDEEDKDFTSIYPLRILDNHGEEIPNMTVDPREIEVEVVIVGETGRKLVGVQPNIKGTPPENSWIKSIVSEPSFVILEGDFDELQKIEYVQTEEIDVSGLDDSGEFNVKIRGLPEAVSVEDETEVKVAVKIEKVRSDDDAIKQKQIDVPVAVVKFRTDQENRVLNPPSVTILVEGTEKDLNKISSSATVELDISEYNDESEVVFKINESNFSVPGGVKIVSVDPIEVNVSW